MGSSTLMRETEISDYLPGVEAPAAPVTEIPRQITTDLTHLAWRSQQRHRRLVSLLLAVILPTALMAIYLFGSRRISISLNSASAYAIRWR